MLDELAESHPQLELNAEDHDELNRAWHRMGVWEDVPESLLKLRERYVVAILTVLSLSIVVDSSKHAGIDWDAYLSCEFLGIYKPEPQAYQTVARLLGAYVEETMMVAVHPPDLAAAARDGMKTAYVKPKLEEMGSSGATDTFDIRAPCRIRYDDGGGCLTPYVQTVADPPQCPTFVATAVAAAVFCGRHGGS